MGINGLLPFTKPASTEIHINSLKGKTAAVDTYCWLHKGAFGCSDKLVMGEKTDGYVLYCMKYIDLLLTFKIKPIMVFDGQNLPAKYLTEKKRRESRQQARKRAIECLKLGNVYEARANFNKCVDITPELALELIEKCRQRNIDCVVAPYEADAQLAYLNRMKIADFVISEDSDLLVFGCSKVLFKLDLTGRGYLVESDKLYLATNERPDNYSQDRFRHMCILSGCDYLDSLPGIGLKKALKFLKCISNNDVYNNLAKMPNILNMSQLVVTKEYREQFMIADATFKHQLVFDVYNKKLVPLTDPEKCGTNLDYCRNAGTKYDDQIAYQVAIGNLNPSTHQVLSKWSPQKGNISSIWCRSSYAIEKPLTISTPKVLPERKQIIKPNTPTNVNDDNIEESLINLYTVKSLEEPPAKKICIREEVVKQGKSSDEYITSPVLTSRRNFINPFLKNVKKNLFSNISPNTKVVSKYFCVENDTSIKTDSTENSETENTEETVISSQTSNKENSDNNETDTSDLLNASNAVLDEKPDTKLLENSTINETETIVQTTSFKMQAFVKCRPQGLLKTNKKNVDNKFKFNKNQPTLLSKFGFTKKKT